jgi:hypothetical protein
MKINGYKSCVTEDQTFFQNCNNLFPKTLHNSRKELHDSHSTLLQAFDTTKKLSIVSPFSNQKSENNAAFLKSCVTDEQLLRLNLVLFKLRK